jgi:hypothetical protein
MYYSCVRLFFFDGSFSCACSSVDSRFKLVLHNVVFIDVTGLCFSFSFLKPGCILMYAIACPMLRPSNAHGVPLCVHTNLDSPFSSASFLFMILC